MPKQSDAASQEARILSALKEGRRLTPLDAQAQFQCMRLGARIWSLKGQGHDIRTTMITTPTGKRVAQYWLQADLPHMPITVMDPGKLYSIVGTSGNTYTVRSCGGFDLPDGKSGTLWACTCPAGEHARTCKHITAVERFIAEPPATEGPSDVREVTLEDVCRLVLRGITLYGVRRHHGRRWEFPVAVDATRKEERVAFRQAFERILAECFGN